MENSTRIIAKRDEGDETNEEVSVKRR